MFEHMRNILFTFPSILSLLLILGMAACTGDEVELKDADDLQETEDDGDVTEVSDLDAVEDVVPDSVYDPPPDPSEPDGPDAWEEPDPSTAPQWSRIFASGSNDEWIHIAPARDGGYFLAGQTDAFLTPEAAVDALRLWMIRLDAYGNVVWQKTDRTKGFPENFKIVATSDGGIAGCGAIRMEGEGWDALSPCWSWAFEMTDNGTILWQKLFMLDGCTCDIQQTEDGGYILAVNSYNNVTSYYDIHVLKLDEEGDLDWVRAYGSEHDDGAREIKQTSDGGYILSIWRYSDPAGAVLFKIGPLGDLQWQKRFHGSESSYGPIFHSVVETPDGGCLAVGSMAASLVDNPYGHSQDNLIAKLDPDGTIEWHRTYHLDEHDSIWNIEKLDGDRYALSGCMGNPSGCEYMLLMKIDGSGEILWEKTYRAMGWPEYAGRGPSMKAAADGGFIVAASAEVSLVGLPVFWVLKVDSEGFLSEDCPTGIGDEVVSTPTEAVLNEEDVTFSVFYPFFEVIPTDLVLEDIPIAPETMCTGGN